MAWAKFGLGIFTPFLMFFMLLANLVVSLASLCPCFWKYARKLYPKPRKVKESKSVPGVREAGDIRYFWPRMKVLFHRLWAEVRMEAEVGGRAPNPRLRRHTNRSEGRLLDLLTPRRPLVINFGSCTCPRFMATLPRFRQMTKEFGAVADFVVVYSAEAHPADGWAIPGNLTVSSHRTMEERHAAAQRMLDLEPLTCPVLVDLLTDQASRAYGGLAERLFVVQDGIIVYKGGPGPCCYKLREVEEWLRKCKGKQ